eukprot:Rmarinus@m.18977
MSSKHHQPDIASSDGSDSMNDDESGEDRPRNAPAPVFAYRASNNSGMRYPEPPSYTTNHSERNGPPESANISPIIMYNGSPVRKRRRNDLYCTDVEKQKAFARLFRTLMKKLCHMERTTGSEYVLVCRSPGKADPHTLCSHEYLREFSEDVARIFKSALDKHAPSRQEGKSSMLSHDVNPESGVDEVSPPFSRFASSLPPISEYRLPEESLSSTHLSTRAALFHAPSSSEVPTHGRVIPSGDIVAPGFHQLSTNSGHFAPPTSSSQVNIRTNREGALGHISEYSELPNVSSPMDRFPSQDHSTLHERESNEERSSHVSGQAVGPVESPACVAPAPASTTDQYQDDDAPSESPEGHGTRVELPLPVPSKPLLEPTRSDAPLNRVGLPNTEIGPFHTSLASAAAVCASVRVRGEADSRDIRSASVIGLRLGNDNRPDYIDSDGPAVGSSGFVDSDLVDVDAKTLRGVLARLGIQRLRQIASRWRKAALPNVVFTRNGEIQCRPDPNLWPSDVSWTIGGVHKLRRDELLTLCLFLHTKLSLAQFCGQLGQSAIKSDMDTRAELRKAISRYAGDPDVRHFRRKYSEIPRDEMVRCWCSVEFASQASLQRHIAQKHKDIPE